MPAGLCWTEGLCAASGPGLWLPCLPLQCWGPREQEGGGPGGAGAHGLLRCCPCGPAPRPRSPQPSEAQHRASLLPLSGPEKGNPTPAGKRLLVATAGPRRKGSKSQETRDVGTLDGEGSAPVTTAQPGGAQLHPRRSPPACVSWAGRGFPGDISVAVRSEGASRPAAPGPGGVVATHLLRTGSCAFLLLSGASDGSADPAQTALRAAGIAVQTCPRMGGAGAEVGLSPTLPFCYVNAASRC